MENLEQTYVQENLSYYRKKWERVISFNWVALFFSFFWLGYRKMYKELFIALAILISYEWVMYLNGAFTEPLLYDAFSPRLLIGISLWLFGNFLYRRKVKKEIMNITSDLSDESNIKKIKQKGGTSSIGLVLPLVIYLPHYLIITSL